MISDLMDVKCIKAIGAYYSVREVMEMLQRPETVSYELYHRLKYYKGFIGCSDTVLQDFVARRGAHRNISKGHFMRMVSEFRHQPIVTLPDELAERLTAKGGDLQTVVVKALRRYISEQAGKYPCPVCGSPSMKDARVSPVKYECFECDHVWTKNESNRRESNNGE